MSLGPTESRTNAKRKERRDPYCKGGNGGGETSLGTLLGGKKSGAKGRKRGERGKGKERAEASRKSWVEKGKRGNYNPPG